MLRRTVFRLTTLVAGLGLAMSCLAATGLAAYGQSDSSSRGRKYKAPAPTGRIEVTILKDVNGKPIENAAVIFHPMEGEKDKGNMELKTNEDGKTIIDVLPIGGTVRMLSLIHICGWSGGQRRHQCAFAGDRLDRLGQREQREQQRNHLFKHQGGY